MKWISFLAVATSIAALLFSVFRPVGLGEREVDVRVEAIVEARVREGVLARESEIADSLKEQIRAVAVKREYWRDPYWEEPESLEELLASAFNMFEVEDGRSVRDERFTSSRAEVEKMVRKVLLEWESQLVREMAPRFGEMFEGGYEKEPESLEELFLPVFEMVE